MKSIFTGHGYFMNDDRASGGKLAEDDIIACGHSGVAMKKSDWKMHGGLCMVCDKPLSAAAVKRAQTFGCEGPEQLKIERALTELHRREQNAKVLGI
jgi:hypothetical protein